MSNGSDASTNLKLAPSFSSITSQNIAILGTGLYGRALASHISSYAPQHVVTVASRSTTTTPAAAASSADIVILAVPSSAHASVIHAIAPLLRPGTIVIDVSNHPLHLVPSKKKKESPAVKLARDVPDGVRVVKAFNTLSPQLLWSPAALESRVPFAADDDVAADAAAFISSLGFTPRHLGPLSTAASEIEAIPHTLFPSLKSTVLVSTIVWAWWIMYSLLASYIIHGSRGTPSRSWDKAPLSVLMASTGETAMTLFAVTFLAGPLARLVQLARGNASKPFGKWFTNWLDARKELGLAAFVFVSAHGIAGAISASHLDDGWKGQLYFVFGIVSYVMFALLALSSGSAISSKMSWAEFRAVFSWLGTAGLVFGVAHQALWGVILHKHRPNPSFWVGGGAIMPIYWVGIMIPLAALLLRVITWSPCVARPLNRLGQGSKVSNEAGQV